VTTANIHVPRGIDTLDRMLVGRRGLSPVLIGRTAVLAGLKALVTGDAAKRDNLPAIALIAGEAGVGKSRLLRELVGALPDGTQVLAAHAQPGSLGRPLDLVHSMLGELPDLAGDGRAIAVDEVVTRVRDRPSLVVFEDLHWADSDSVAVFESLAGISLPELTLVATYRPEDLTSRLPGGEMLVRLERRRHVHQVHLDPLDRHEIAAFVAAVYGRNVSTGVIDSLRRRTGGNPFFLEEILGVAGDVAPEALADQPLPWSLAELVSRQLDGLSPDERRVVETAAVLGARARFEVLASLSRRSEDELITDLRSLVERGLLVEEDDDRFSFRHELVRDAVEGQLLGRERRRLHEQALDTLGQWRYTDIADLARHAAGAGRYDEMVELAREGVGHYLGLGSTYQALQLAVAALAESPDDHDLLAGAARAAWLIGAHDEAWSHVGRLLDVTAGGVSEPRLAAIGLAARIAHERNDTEQAWALTRELQTAVGGLPPSEERARSMAAIAQIHMLNREPALAVERAERAAAEAEAVGAKDVWAQAMVERGTSLTDLPERRGEGLVALIDAIGEAERVEDWVLVARGLNNLANVAPPATGAPTSSECVKPVAGPGSTTSARRTISSGWPTSPRPRVTPRPHSATPNGPATMSTRSRGAGRRKAGRHCSSRPTASMRLPHCWPVWTLTRAKDRTTRTRRHDACSSPPGTAIVSERPPNSGRSKAPSAARRSTSPSTSSRLSRRPSSPASPKTRCSPRLESGPSSTPFHTSERCTTRSWRVPPPATTM